MSRFFVGFFIVFLDSGNMNVRRSSAVDTQIHVNPNRPQTPIPTRSPSRMSRNKLNVPQSVQTELDQDVILSNDGRQSETMFFRFDEKAGVKSMTPVTLTYGSMEAEKPALETSPLLSGTQ